MGSRKLAAEEKEEARPRRSGSLLGPDSAIRSLRTPEWAAEFLGVGVEWVLEAAQRGELPCFHLGESIRFDPMGLKDWVRRNAAAANDAPAAGERAGLGGAGDNNPHELNALLKETRAMRQLLEAPRPPSRPESVTLDEAARMLGCSKRRVEQLLQEGVIRAGRRFGKRAMVTLESIEAALRPNAPRSGPGRRDARPRTGTSWKPIDRTRLK